MKKLSFNSILEKIFSLYRLKSEKLLVLLVGGLSRSGKSYFSKRLVDEILDKNIDSKIISLDNWIIDLDKRTGEETVRERFDYSQIVCSVSNYLKGSEISTRKYDPKSRKILDINYNIKPMKKGIVIIDGVIALDISELRLFSSLNIYVETSETNRLDRFFDFHTNIKKLSRNDATKIYEERQIDEIFLIKENKCFADIVYVN